MPNIPNNPFILVDGSSYLFRAYHALPPLTNNEGFPTGAIYGVVNMLRKLLITYNTTKMAVVFDTPDTNFRHELFPEYKANRGKMSEELAVQIEPLYEIIKALGLQVIAESGWEADDVIGTLAKQAFDDKQFILISTGDKDFAQLVNKQIFLINTMNDKIFDEDAVIEKFGVPPSLMIDYLTLVGDSVDNIPGVPKVGPKTASKWLSVYKNLDNLITHADDIKGKVGESLRSSLFQLPLTKELVTIRLNVPLAFKWQDLKVQNITEDKLFELFKKYQFRQWQANVNSFLSNTDKVTNNKQEHKLQYETITKKEAFIDWLTEITTKKIFALDTETTSLNPLLAKLVGISFAFNETKAAYVPIAHEELEQLPLEWVLDKLKPILNDKEYIIIGHNLKYDILVLEGYGITVQAQLFDTMLASYVYNSTASRHDLYSLALYYLNKKTIKFEDVAGKGVKKKTFDKVAVDIATEYAAEDALITFLLHNKFTTLLAKVPSLLSLFTSLEMPLIKVLSSMESHGVLIESGNLLVQSNKLQEELAKLTKQAFRLANEEFNINSPKQLQKVLFEDLKLPVLEKTPTGQPSTAESVLQSLAADYELPAIILEYRSLSKLKSTYTDKLPKQINPNTGRLHTSYNQAVAGTGRLSSTEPNLQNIPIKHELGRKIRTAFIAPEEYLIVAADYSQIELRIMAHLSQDKGLLQAFNNGEDVHTSTAAQIFEVCLQAVTAEQRRAAKAVNFGLMYGMSSFGLAKQLGITRDAAQEVIELYFKKFPGVQQFMQDIRTLALRQGFVETLHGRRLYLPDIKSANVQRRLAAERAAINAPMQGSNADIIKLAMLHIDTWLTANPCLRVNMIMQVHDELVFEIHKDDLQEATKKIAAIMESAGSLDVPTVVNIGVGNNWHEAH